MWLFINSFGEDQSDWLQRCRAESTPSIGAFIQEFLKYWGPMGHVEDVIQDLTTALQKEGLIHNEEVEEGHCHPKESIALDHLDYYSDE